MARDLIFFRDAHFGPSSPQQATSLDSLPFSPYMAPWEVRLVRPTFWRPGELLVKTGVFQLALTQDTPRSRAWVDDRTPQSAWRSPSLGGRARGSCRQVPPTHQCPR